MSTLKVDNIRHNNATSDAITMASDGTCTAKITSVNGGSQLSHRNLIINGSMIVAQRLSAPSVHQGEGYRTVDRFRYNVDPNPNEQPNQEQHVLTSGDTGPYEEGFRFSYLVENGNQGTQPSNGNIEIFHRVESQNLANSGWNYTSTSSFITLSFWAKSSVTQTFYGRVTSETGTTLNFPYEIDLVGGTWKKFTIKIPGHASLGFTNTNGSGMRIEWVQAAGTDQSGSATLNQWSTYSSTDRYPAVASTWYDTDNATYEITGVQLEVGDTPTTFEHRSYAEELIRCKRYYQTNSFTTLMGSAAGQVSTPMIMFPVEMREAPSSVTVEYGGNGNGSFRNQNTGSTLTGHTIIVTYKNGFTARGSSGSANIIYSSVYKAECEL
tara:strand:- start:45 stop:1187 length:1143 start_codon:yes stop_codon:yes gene_type:complete